MYVNAFVIEAHNGNVQDTNILIKFQNCEFVYFWRTQMLSGKSSGTYNHYVGTHTSTHSLSLILLLRCNAEQELVMHYMLLALAEVRRKQDQYY